MEWCLWTSYHHHHLYRIGSQSAVLRSPYHSSLLPLHSASILITEHNSEVNPHPQSTGQGQDYLSPSKLVCAYCSHLVLVWVHMHTLTPPPHPHPLLQNLLGIKNVRRDFHYAIYDLCRNIAETKWVIPTGYSGMVRIDQWCTCKYYILPTCTLAGLHCNDACVYVSLQTFNSRLLTTV